MHNISHVVSSYRRYAPWYDRLFGRVLAPGRLALGAAVSDLQPKNLLEIGVGTGLTLACYPQNTSITGVDISDEMLAIAASRARELNLTIHLANMDAEKLQFDDNSFECVVLPYVLSVTPNPHQLVAEMRRVCKSGGHIFIVNHFSGSGFWYFLEKLAAPFAKRIGFNSEFAFADHVACHDWKIVSVTTVNLMGLSKLVHLINTK